MFDIINGDYPLASWIGTNNLFTYLYHKIKIDESIISVNIVAWKIKTGALESPYKFLPYCSLVCWWETC